MSCLPLPATFRLLDSLVGWDPDSVEGITGLDLASGLQLAFVGGVGGIVPADDVSAWLAPAALARGCAPCEWFLVTPCPPESRLLRKDVCSPCFTEAEPGAVGALRCAVAVATAGRNVAVADAGQNAVLLFADHGRRLVTRGWLRELPGPSPTRPGRSGWSSTRRASASLVSILPGFARGHLRPALPGSGRSDGRGQRGARLGRRRRAAARRSHSRSACGLPRATTRHSRVRPSTTCSAPSSPTASR